VLSTQGPACCCLTACWGRMVRSDECAVLRCAGRAVCAGVRVPPSLVNVYKELAQDVGAQVPKHGCLQKVRACGWVGANGLLKMWWC
jgi:hypothetical protein